MYRWLLSQVLCGFLLLVTFNILPLILCGAACMTMCGGMGGCEAACVAAGVVTCACRIAVRCAAPRWQEAWRQTDRSVRGMTVYGLVYMGVCWMGAPPVPPQAPAGGGAPRAAPRCSIM